MRVVLATVLCLSFVALTLGATAEQWRGRSIYQIITDRYALPAGTNKTQCNPGDQTWCGGNWNAIREHLDYIQNAGFTAIWISPVSQNYDGPRSPYGDAYHGYWIADATKLNDRFGTADDLKALSDELHKRGMYLMVDVVVNNVMSTSITPDLSTFMFKQKSQYHPYCPIQWGNATSEQNCWLGDLKVPLPDVNTQDPGVVSAYCSWIQSLVSEFDIDGLRIDAAKHVNMDFWPTFCKAAGVFCIGEVFDNDMSQAAQYQGPDALDSILNYPMYGALVNAFAIPGQRNASAVTDAITQSKALFKFRNFLVNGTTGWLKSQAEVLTTGPYGLAIMKGQVVTILTNIGSPPQNASVAAYTTFHDETAVTDILSCAEYAVGSNGTLEISYIEGGAPAVLIPNNLLRDSNLCGFTTSFDDGEGAAQAASSARVDAGQLSWRSWVSQATLLILVGVCTFLTL
ncbi:uncharacterized protein FIBRA_05982 [Fibroporia radiculosa]|uniref:alpha-amylase n=1 Tax=Fibroporia radiculosa TaxID=599839 RepID=J4GAG1_9APHY|nr:uncharacterized protein FIBRA_05982 [Fibroporia radiculosa]CCM03833.1 predicted protein [Fibroporia radiculosa]